MPFESVDRLQKTLADRVFTYASDRKKAAGRALGTLVELITYYTLRAWDLGGHIVIERRIPEFGSPDITHNVEFSLHPILDRSTITIEPVKLPITTAKITKHLNAGGDRHFRSASLLSQNMVKRNACVLSDDEQGIVVAHLDSFRDSRANLSVYDLQRHPFSIFECKRVGVEEGMRKGPQTIEKAKQGAYVARTVSSLQKFRLRDGRILGILERTDGSLRTAPYAELLREAVDGADPAVLSGFILTVGVASNHGNWFTSANPNKELRVLAQSYDWLLFLTDSGLAQFIDRLLLKPTKELRAARDAFMASYTGKAGSNQFTKVKTSVLADSALRTYFADHEPEIESWFNVITPSNGTLICLRADLGKLAAKDWKEIAANDRRA